MKQRPTWPELDRLARFMRAADSMTDTLAAWTGRGVAVEIVRRLDRVFPGPEVAEMLALHDDAWVQEREVLLRCADLVVASVRSWVAVDSAALTPAVRLALRAGSGLGDVIPAQQRRRTTVRVVPQRATPEHDHETPVLTVQARLDVGGTPVAWCEETIYEAVFAWDRSVFAGSVIGARPARTRVPA